MNIAIYARVSSDKQARHETIESQVAALRKFAQDHGFSIDDDLVFVDPGVSGASLVRPALDALRDRASRGEVERLLVHSPDRLARKYVHPDTLAVLVVGNQAAFEKPLSTLGTVTPIDITIPPPPAK